MRRPHVATAADVDAHAHGSGPTGRWEGHIGEDGGAVIMDTEHLILQVMGGSAGAAGMA
ncbi:MAG: hypothetical protein ACRDS9_05285 [Pseudonocardiaceae bacterium]